MTHDDDKVELAPEIATLLDAAEQTNNHDDARDYLLEALVLSVVQLDQTIKALFSPQEPA